VRIEELDYDLPRERIAQHPCPERDASKLLVLRRNGEPAVEDAVFRDVGRFLCPGDLLVLNETKVFPARLEGRKTTGGAIELLLVEPDPASSAHESDDRAGAVAREWLCLAGFSRPPAPGSRLAFGPELEGVYLGPASGELHRVRLEAQGGVMLRDAIERRGEVPLPPYIVRGADRGRAEEDRERYQTEFAESEGAIAAPTAGLHFTLPLLRRLEADGIATARLTLHVGPATFLPVRVPRIEDHAMPAERYVVPAETVSAVARSRAAGGRVIAVGTTVVRALESAADGRGGILPARGRTDLYILPGHRFRVVDALITNFHLPRSTLLAMVCAFAGRDRVLSAYHRAVEAGYRFYSYGDAMLIL